LNRTDYGIDNAHDFHISWIGASVEALPNMLSIYLGAILPDLAVSAPVVTVSVDYLLNITPEEFKKFCDVRISEVNYVPPSKSKQTINKAVTKLKLESGEEAAKAYQDVCNKVWEDKSDEIRMELRTLLPMLLEEYVITLKEWKRLLG
jgi:hypothetical protein